MKQEIRLRRSSEIQRVRRLGKSYAHPLVVLVVLPMLSPNSQENGSSLCTYLTAKKDDMIFLSHSNIHIGIIAGIKIGNAVQRNRAKRRIRACIDHLYPYMSGNNDLLIIARKSITLSSFKDIKAALINLFQKSGLIEYSNNI